MGSDENLPWKKRAMNLEQATIIAWDVDVVEKMA